MGLWLFTENPGIQGHEYGITGGWNQLYGGPSRYKGIGIFILPDSENPDEQDIIHAQYNTGE